MPARLQLGVLSSFAALACVLMLSACGGSSKPKPQASRANVFMALSKCMRAHGVTNFPDPSSGGEINIAGTGVNPRSPAFKGAQTVCFKRLPGGGPLNHKASAQQIGDARQTSECMRGHGVSDFPDPIVSNSNVPPSSLNPTNYSQISDSGGIIIAIPNSINTQSPAFEKAAKACQFER
jgi:hypothetical protein